jgi:pimeloyl-ACP methyl ester carboxylesterase
MLYLRLGNKTGRVVSLLLPVAALLWSTASHAAEGCARSERGERPVQIEHATIKPAEGGTDVAVLEGMLSVPERRANPKARCVQIAFYQLKSGDPAATPLFVVSGGPGVPLLEEFAEDAEWRQHLLKIAEGRDLVLVEQRSVGKSRPILSHPPETQIALDKPLDPVSAIAIAKSDAERSAAALKAHGVDTAGYTVTEFSDDIDDLRAALGYKKIIIYGESFGSHTSMTHVRRHGKRVERAIVALPEGVAQTYKLPQMGEDALDRITMLVKADPVWGAIFPDFKAALARQIAVLDKMPVTVNGVDDGKPYTITLGGNDLRWWAGSNLARFGFLKAFPKNLHAMQKGDYGSLGAYAYERRTNGLLNDVGPWFHLADRASGVSPTRLKQIELQRKTSTLGWFVDFPHYEYPAQSWGKTDLGEKFRAPVQTNVPTLFVVSTLDARTPLSNYAEIAPGFRNHGLIRAGDIGHNQPFIVPENAERFAADLRRFLGKAKPFNRDYTYTLSFDAPPASHK